ncbi:MAG: phosphoribosylamine--glycine ligase [Nocardioidaceae bacterium]|nr:phosphoribosylamine--glycine ligase [Nocardioidaceae bacterium]
MKVLVIGGGGREHALVRALSRDPEMVEVHAAPGNPGMAALATLHDEISLVDTGAVLVLAKSLAVDLVIIGPEDPLVAGVADPLRIEGIACFGPDREAAALEGSKAYAKEVMAAAGIPTAQSYLCEDANEVDAALDSFGPPYVVKDDGLAAGKGVVVTSDRASAVAHAAACERVVIEEYLDGPEVSLFGICDGVHVCPMLPAQDFKRLLDGDEGPNTGGMGAYAPLRWLPEGFVDDVTASVLQPTVDEMQRRGTPFVGLLYAGLAMTSGGVKVVEFNVRFGDPETQVLLELLDTPLGQLLHAAATGRLDEFEPLRWRPGAAVAVVMAAAGYPDAPRKGDAISGVDAVEALDGVHVLHAGTRWGQGAGETEPAQSASLETAGGRVLAVTATGPDLETAHKRAYVGVRSISFEGAQHRADIARAAAESEGVRQGAPVDPSRQGDT